MEFIYGLLIGSLIYFVIKWDKSNTEKKELAQVKDATKKATKDVAQEIIDTKELILWLMELRTNSSKAADVVHPIFNIFTKDGEDGLALAETNLKVLLMIQGLAKEIEEAHTLAGANASLINLSQNLVHNQKLNAAIAQILDRYRHMNM